MKFKKRAKEDSGDTQWYFQIEDDGTSRIQCTEKYPEFIEVEKKFGYGDSKDNMLIANQDEDEADPSYGIKYERLVPVLVNAIKELSTRLDAGGL